MLSPIFLSPTTRIPIRNTSFIFHGTQGKHLFSINRLGQTPPSALPPGPSDATNDVYVCPRAVTSAHPPGEGNSSKSRAALHLASRNCCNTAEPQQDITAASRTPVVVFLKKKAESVPPAALKLELRS